MGQVLKVEKRVWIWTFSSPNPMGVLFDAYDFEPGDPISKMTIDKIKESYFAIVVISDQLSDAMFEMGICVGLQKPFFLLIGPKCEIKYGTHPIFF